MGGMFSKAVDNSTKSTPTVPQNTTQSTKAKIEVVQETVSKTPVQELKLMINKENHPTVYSWAPYLAGAGNYLASKLGDETNSNWLITAIKSVLVFLITVLSPIEYGLTKFVEELKYVYDHFPEALTAGKNKVNSCVQYFFPAKAK
jgi:hypothetical protein